LKQLTVISGKGGTGKTSLVAAFAQCAAPAVLADCDVDASNLPILLQPIGESRSEPFTSGYFVKLDPSLCDGCRICEEVCRFGAVEFETAEGGTGDALPRFDYYACEGCGACVDACPPGAIALVERVSGTLYVSRMRYGPLVHAELGIAEGMSGKLVTMVRERATEIAEREGLDLVLVDGSPGIGCPVIASMAGVDAVLIVTEPTVAGRHDLDRIAELTQHFRITSAAIVNKFDLNIAMTEEIEEACRARGIRPLGRIGFDPVFVKAMVEGKTVLEYADGEIGSNLRRLWERMMGLMQGAGG
jgi:MinD superfamily P-loop ATPase